MASNMDASQNTSSDSLLTKMSNCIWMDEKLCNEEKFLKRKWFLRNGQDTHEEGKYERHVMFLVVEKTERKNVKICPVIQGSIPSFTVCQGKKKTVHEALCFL